MNTTLLLDLDGTLLENDIDVSLPVYIQLFSKHVADLIDPDLFVQSLIAGSRLMVENSLPDRTLEEVFKSYFFAKTGLDEAQFYPYSEEFYTRIYPEVRPYTKQIPGVEKFIESVVDLGFSIVIATNPLFPRTAVLQRLSWAGIPIDRYPFQLVTSFENSHFAKPNPAYYTEILGKLGWSDSRIVVVGDELGRDIYPSNLLGLETFWIEQPGETHTNHPAIPTASGSIQDVIPWLQKTTDKPYKPDMESIPTMLSILRSTPAVLIDICSQIDVQDWGRRPDSENWCPTEIVCHLRDVENEVNIPRVYQILNENKPFLTGVDTDAWATLRNYRDQDGPIALQSFTQHRIELLKLLDGFGDDDWLRPAQHSIFGRTSIKELVRISCSHDIMHIRQLYHDLRP